MSTLLRKLPLRKDSPEGSSKSKNLPKLRQIYAPPPLPPKRKRNLTLPFPSPISKTSNPTRQWTSEQDHCGFLQVLPYDVRRIIYEMLLANEHFHIIRLRRKLRHIRCKISPKNSSHNKTCWGMSTVDGILIRDLEKNPLGHGLLELLRTCRRIYTEAIDILYSQNIYDINGPESLVSFSRILLPHRLNAIRSLQMTWAFFHAGQTVFDEEKILLQGDEALWTACWAIVSSMKGLNDLRIWLSMSPAAATTRKPEHALLIPLARIGPKKRFDVRVSWNLFQHEKRVQEDYPFRLIRLQEEDWGAIYLQAPNG